MMWILQLNLDPMYIYAFNEIMFNIEDIFTEYYG